MKPKTIIGLLAALAVALTLVLVLVLVDGGSSAHEPPPGCDVVNVLTMESDLEELVPPLPGAKPSRQYQQLTDALNACDKKATP
jgi:hypothetical protein